MGQFQIKIGDVYKKYLNFPTTVPLRQIMGILNEYNPHHNGSSNSSVVIITCNNLHAFFQTLIIQLVTVSHVRTGQNVWLGRLMATPVPVHLDGLVTSVTLVRVLFNSSFSCRCNYSYLYSSSFLKYHYRYENYYRVIIIFLISGIDLIRFILFFQVWFLLNI